MNHTQGDLHREGRPADIIRRLVYFLGGLLPFRKSRTPTAHHLKLGARGEKLAAKTLRRSGCTILTRNYRCKVGEIDLIALHGQTICFVEVKTRRPGQLLPPQRAVTVKKQKRIRRAAKSYLRSKQLVNRVCRFDIIAITYPEKGKPQIEHFTNAF